MLRTRGWEHRARSNPNNKNASGVGLCAADRWRALTGHFTTTLSVRNDTKWPARLIIRVADPQPSDFKPTVEMAPSGGEEGLAVEVALRRSGVGKRRAQIYVVFPQVGRTLHFQVGTPCTQRPGMGGGAPAAQFPELSELRIFRKKSIFAELNSETAGPS